MKKIPKIIHYVWLGKKEKPDLFYKCLSSWKKYCPDYEIKEWNEDNFDFSDCLFAKQAYEKKKFAFVSDYIRVKVLQMYGGIYLDTDVEIVKCFDELLENDFCISFENNCHCSTACILSTKNHPILEQISKLYLSKSFIKPNDQIDSTPNPPLWTYFLKTMFGMKLNNKKQILHLVNGSDKYSVTILPKDYFSPLNYTTKKLKPTFNTFAIHYFNATWFTKKLKLQEKFLKFVYYLFTPYLFACFTKIWLSCVFKDIKKSIALK